MQFIPPLLFLALFPSLLDLSLLKSYYRSGSIPELLLTLLSNWKRSVKPRPAVSYVNCRPVQAAAVCPPHSACVSASACLLFFRSLLPKLIKRIVCVCVCIKLELSALINIFTMNMDQINIHNMKMVNILKLVKIITWLCSCPLAQQSSLACFNLFFLPKTLSLALIVTSLSCQCCLQQQTADFLKINSLYMTCSAPISRQMGLTAS